MNDNFQTKEEFLEAFQNWYEERPKFYGLPFSFYSTLVMVVEDDGEEYTASTHVSIEAHHMTPHRISSLTKHMIDKQMTNTLNEIKKTLI